MTELALLFAQAERRLIAHIEKLAEHLDAGGDVWAEYRASLETLKHLIGESREPLLTTKQAAEKFGVKPRTIRKRASKLGLEPVRIGARGRAAIRWRA